MLEKETRKQEAEIALSYVVIRPGGNDTALVLGTVENATQRKMINDQIMEQNPNVEQVGFLYQADGKNYLQMAGGEFCGNATRSSAMYLLNGQPGEIQLKVSGVDYQLKAGVNEEGEAWAQMPIRSELSNVREVDEKTSIVALDGITQVVTTMQLPAELSTEEIKAKAKAILEKYDLLQSVPAAGVMFVNKVAGVTLVRPVVWVRDIETLFYETACGSGTTAIGLVEAKKNGGNVRLPVVQPSGMPISIAVDFDGKQFTSATISGPVERLGNASLERKVDFAKINEEGDLNEEKKTALIELYQSVFRDPPYNEEFTNEEVLECLQLYWSVGILLIAEELGVPIGFAAAIPLLLEPAIAELAQQYGFDADQTWYYAELGVEKTKRRQGLGTTLAQQLVDQIPAPSVLMRTAEANQASQLLNQKIGFKVVDGMEQLVTQKRKDGQVETDRRIFLAYEQTE